MACQNFGLNIRVEHEEAHVCIVNFSCAVSISTRLLRLHSLAVGSVTVDDPVLQQVPHVRMRKFNALGMDFLRRFRVLLDFPAQQMYLTPDPAFREDPQEYIRTGAEFTRRDDKIVVSRVLSGSSAKRADLQEGDEVIAWGRLAAKDISDLIMETWNQVKADTELIFIIQHPGSKTTRIVTLKAEKLL